MTFPALLSIIVITLFVVVKIYRSYQKFKREDIEREKRYRQHLHDDQLSLLFHALKIADERYQDYLKDEDRPAAVQQYSETIADILSLRNLLEEAVDVELLFKQLEGVIRKARRGREVLISLH